MIFNQKLKYTLIYALYSFNKGFFSFLRNTLLNEYKALFSFIFFYYS